MSCLLKEKSMLTKVISLPITGAATPNTPESFSLGISNSLIYLLSRSSSVLKFLILYDDLLIISLQSFTIANLAFVAPRSAIKVLIFSSNFKKTYSIKFSIYEMK